MKALPGRSVKNKLLTGKSSPFGIAWRVSDGNTDVEKYT